MGNAPSNYLPLDALDCKTADAAAEGARYDYQCTTNNQVRYGLTLVHLFILCVTLLLSMSLYLVYHRICERRVHSQLRAVPKRLPVGRDVLSARMHAAIVEGFARVARPEFVPPPQHPWPAPAAAAAGAAERARFRTGVFVALQRLSVAVREALADELWVLRDGLRGARGLLLSDRFRAPPRAVDTVLAALALAGLDYRGLLGGGGGGDDEDDEDGSGGGGGAGGAAGLAQPQPAPLPVSARGVQLVDEAVEAIVAALGAAAARAARDGGGDGDGDGDARQLARMEEEAEAEAEEEEVGDGDVDDDDDAGLEGCDEAEDEEAHEEEEEELEPALEGLHARGAGPHASAETLDTEAVTASGGGPGRGEL